MTNPVCIYVLKLTNNKYYIGKTTNPQFRLNQHFNSTGSAWTTKYKPLKVIKIIPDCDNFDEDKYTKQYMLKYGIQNVRGGSFCQINLSVENINTIKKELDSATDKCYNCGKTGHFANKCPDVNKSDDELQKMYEILYEEDRCFRCHRIGHYSEKCYAKTYDNGEKIMSSDEESSDDELSDEESSDDELSDDELSDTWGCTYCGKEFNSKKGATYHENIYCKKKSLMFSNTAYKKKDTCLSNSKCYKCGKYGHYSNNCYSSKKIEKQFIYNSDDY